MYREIKIMEYLYVLAAFIFVTAIALMLKAKREKKEKNSIDKDLKK